MDLGWLFIIFIVLSFIQELYGRPDYGIYLIVPIVGLIQHFSKY
jgi:hypothetical protein